ncbi:helix-turn-helix domain-containing protein [Duganella sp. FT94W]|uniref:Helix-turn-helix domain-containing protein n=1 Tax=Duganella lactea TaxID=2692173 RepID=A0ABW9V3D0_9BURK|nr:IclR family transcriptional regulator [Duganella lactea]MYM33295.1 helix-turn-helix domain-containing protein [Duganella lactea]
MKQPSHPATAVARQQQPSQNRSLERGLAILKTFRPGSDVMGNGDIADKTGLARSTVSRLTQTLVHEGMLEYDAERRGYRLGVAVLSLALAMRLSNQALQVATPLMREASEKFRVNVGLAIADGDEMVYLESIRYNRKLVLRTIVSGQRIPIELTSLGRAYLAAAPDSARTQFMQRLATRVSAKSPTVDRAALERDIEAAIASVQRHGYCAAAWQPEVVALATPITLPHGAAHILNMSTTTAEPFAEVVEQLRQPLLALRAGIEGALRR